MWLRIHDDIWVKHHSGYGEDQTTESRVKPGDPISPSPEGLFVYPPGSGNEIVSSGAAPAAPQGTGGGRPCFYRGSPGFAGPPEGPVSTGGGKVLRKFRCGREENRR